MSLFMDHHMFKTCLFLIMFSLFYSQNKQGEVYVTANTSTFIGGGVYFPVSSQVDINFGLGTTLVIIDGNLEFRDYLLY